MPVKPILKAALTFLGFLLAAVGVTLLAIYVAEFRSSTDTLGLMGAIVFAIGATTLWHLRGNSGSKGRE